MRKVLKVTGKEVRLLCEGDEMLVIAKGMCKSAAQWGCGFKWTTIREHLLQNFAAPTEPDFPGPTSNLKGGTSDVRQSSYRAVEQLRVARSRSLIATSFILRIAQKNSKSAVNIVHSESRDSPISHLLAVV